MLEKKKAFEILQKALSYSKSEMAEAVLESERMSLTRFAESKISDNIDKEETTLYIRSVKGKKMGVSATGDLTDEGIKKVVAGCEAVLEYMLPDDRFISFPTPTDIKLKEDLVSEGTSNFGPKERAEAVSLMSRIARKGNMKTSGAFRIDETALAVAGSLGVQRFFTGNSAQLSLTVSGDSKNSGWAMEYNADASRINVDALGKKATHKAAMSRNPVALPDGQYTVILEPAAVGQLLLLLSFMGFGCKTFYQKRSFMAGKIGEKIAGDNFSVYEDPDDADFNFRPIDYEGVPRTKVALIENGVAKGVVYNSYYANLMGTESTGHALQPTNMYGPYPKTMSVAPGDSTIEEMIKSTEKGVLITHFWYLNFLNPMRTMVTGTTVDGTFHIENGVVGSPIKNMRTNQSILEAFSSIEAITRDRIVYPQYSVLMKVPGMKINNFNLQTEEEDEGKC
ncbi:MAG: TldD/PmbA family protein [Candidatus Zixiibacteriota bacterium]|nr:MAG: TldD/PmbA family protein [candidate division Zixibacteria bacterium]